MYGRVGFIDHTFCLVRRFGLLLTPYKHPTNTLPSSNQINSLEFIPIFLISVGVKRVGVGRVFVG